MTHPMRRRSFLRTVGAAAITSSSLSPVAPCFGREPPSTASSQARLFPGCCAYSYARRLKSGQLTMEDFVRKAVELGVLGVDITVYWLKSTDAAYLAALRHLAFQNGVPLSGAACGASMVQAEASKRVQVLADIKKWVDVTDRLGASHLRIFAGELPKGATTEQGIAWSVETMKPACEYAAERGITLGLEDHGGISESAEVTLEIIRKVNSPFAGVNLDISNFSAASDEDQYKQIEACIPHATHTHIRDRFSNSHRPIDLDRVWQLFAKAGYKGYMSAEYEGEEDPLTGVPKLMAQIKTLCRKYSSV